jgi:hypothetical protein
MSVASFKFLMKFSSKRLLMQYPELEQKLLLNKNYQETLMSKALKSKLGEGEAAESTCEEYRLNLIK